MKWIVLFSSLVLLSACSSKQLYQMGKGHQRSACIKDANMEIQLNECEREAKERVSFEEYERQRNAVGDSK